jgi:hypothetical protein
MRVKVMIPILLAAGTVVAVANCGGGYSNPNSPGGAGGGGVVGATITIRSDGTVAPTEVRIEVGQRVRFVNEHSGQHQPTSNPHLFHTDCPAMNLPIMNSGQNANTGIFQEIKACGFHDHINPDTATLYGTIRVGPATNNPGPVYVKQ